MAKIDKYNPTQLERDEYEERAAIIEFEGDESRATAELKALIEFGDKRKKK